MLNLANKLNQWQTRHRRVLPAALGLALVYTLAINVFRDYQLSIQQLLPRLALVFVLLVYAPQGLQKRRVLPFAILGAISGFFIVAMWNVVTPEGAPRGWPLWLWLPFLLFSATYCLCFCGASVLLQRVSLRGKPATAAQGMPQTKPLPAQAAPSAQTATGGKKCPRQALWAFTKKHPWLCLFLLLLACWLPLLLAYGPTRMSADSVAVLGQAVGGNPLSDSHPILYTFIVAACLHLGQLLGSILVGAYLFGMLQLSFLAAVLSYSVHWLRKNGCPALLCLPAFAVFALSPVFAINGLTMWKDVPFNACLLLLVMALVPICQSRGAWLADNRHMAAFFGLAAAICFLRGNGFPLLFATCAGLLLAFRPRWKRLLPCFAGFLAAVALIQGPVYAAFGLTRLGTVESAAMPLQQVGRAIAHGAELDDQQREIIERFVPVETIRTNYSPPSPDYIKRHPTFNTPAFNQNFGDFMLVWLQLAPPNAGEYANAWLLETLGYWKFDFAGRTVYTEDENNGVYGIEYKDLVHRFTGLNLRQFALDRSAFFTMGVMALAVLFACAHLIACRRSRMALCFLPLVLLWLGLMAGAPTYSDFRYMLVFAFALPVVVFIALAGPYYHGEGTA